MLTCTCCNTQFDLSLVKDIEEVFAEIDLENNFLLCWQCYEHIYNDVLLDYILENDPVEYPDIIQEYDDYNDLYFEQLELMY